MKHLNAFFSVAALIALQTASAAESSAPCTLSVSKNAKNENVYQLRFTTTSGRAASSLKTTDLATTLAYADRLHDSGRCPSVAFLDAKGNPASTCRIEQGHDDYTIFIGSVEIETHGGDWGYERASERVYTLRALKICQKVIEPKSPKAAHESAEAKLREALALLVGQPGKSAKRENEAPRKNVPSAPKPEPKPEPKESRPSDVQYTI